MQTPEKKTNHIKSKKNRMLLLVLLALFIAIAVFAYVKLNRKEPAVIESTPQLAPLVSGTEKDITAIEVFQNNQKFYEVKQTQEGYQLVGYENLLLEEDEIQRMFSFACEIIVKEKLDDNGHSEEGHTHTQEEEEDHQLSQSDFGLAEPQLKIIVHSQNGKNWHFSFGDQVPFENLYYFSFNDTDDVYIVESGFFDMFDRPGNFLVKTEELSISRQRIDQVSFTFHKEKQTVTLRLNKEGEDQLFYWRMEEPVSYPCDPEKIDELLSQLEDLYLGAYVGEATEENLKKYGFSSPTATIEMHQKAATMGRVGMEGVYETQDYPQESLTLTIGGLEKDYVYYGLTGGKIYLVSSLTVPAIKGVSYQNLLLKRPALFPLESLSSLYVLDERKEEKQEITYSIQKEEQLLENGEVATDEEGNDIVATNVYTAGKLVDQQAFKVGYTALIQVSVAGTLPEDYQWDKTLYTLEMKDEEGTVRTIELSFFDTVHYAVRIDGEALFSIRKGELEQAVIGLQPKDTGK